mmetsp:Transcript_133011/g.284308  ORF Transcript_133011/g.284308 Transcript_133011/m.284308 type:complete len:215 (-) Transcript_133011:340-984(-)
MPVCASCDQIPARPSLPAIAESQSPKLIRVRCDCKKYLRLSRTSRLELSPNGAALLTTSPTLSGSPGATPSAASAASSSEIEAAAKASISSTEGNGNSRGFHSICKDSTVQGVTRPLRINASMSTSRRQSEKESTLTWVAVGKSKPRSCTEVLSTSIDRKVRLEPSVIGGGPVGTVSITVLGLRPLSGTGGGTTFGFGRRAGWGEAPTALQSFM